MAQDEIPTPALLRLVYNELTKHVFEAVAAHAPGLRPSHGNVMEHLDHADDGLRLTDIAQAAGIAPQSVGELVDQLEQLGYVERRPDPDDRRAKRIHLTPRARKYQRISRQALAEIEADLATVLGERGRARLRKALLDVLGSRGGAPTGASARTARARPS